jgi:hypothetical protein
MYRRFHEVFDKANTFPTNTQLLLPFFYLDAFALMLIHTIGKEETCELVEFTGQ